MAKLWFKFQWYFCRKPLHFFTFLVLYLTTRSLVFLHSGFVGQPAVSQRQASLARGGPAQGNKLPFLGNMHLARGFQEGEASSIPLTATIPDMSVDKRVDLCTEKEYPLDALAGTACHCGIPTTRFPLLKREEEQLCEQKCSTDELESYNRCMDRRFLPAKSKQLIPLASFPGAGNMWAHHLIELAPSFYTGSYYFDSSLYNKVRRRRGQQETSWAGEGSLPQGTGMPLSERRLCARHLVEVQTTTDALLAPGCAWCVVLSSPAQGVWVGRGKITCPKPHNWKPTSLSLYHTGKKFLSFLLRK
ncbi:WSC domain-containing protein 2 [Sciurus carolinensis]|uniref:WSC domain-containing protein 2 n=1 Tax=Sciurus carolinensis TaxID=30640 RepID=A0AA41MP79_SCICA|nr:WSC domain-containing protein 2 [Sciurus carolinensis]